MPRVWTHGGVLSRDAGGALYDLLNGRFCADPRWQLRSADEGSTIFYTVSILPNKYADTALTGL